MAGKLLSRVGASEDLAAGRSTFMVEVLETAAILSQATGRSLVILDEVGRGTSTHDRLAVAQACMEHLHDVVRCRTLFATRFHELAETRGVAETPCVCSEMRSICAGCCRWADVADAMPRAACMAMDAAAGRHGDVFTYRIGPGQAGRLHGLKVAALAGLPAPVLARAAELLVGCTTTAPSVPPLTSPPAPLLGTDL